MSQKKLIATIRNNASALLVFTGTLCLIVLLGISFYVQGQSIMHDHLRHLLKTEAHLSVHHFAVEDIERVHGPKDMDSEALRRLVMHLNHIRDSADQIAYTYLMRKTDDPDFLAFVADADSLASPEELDENGDGIVSADEEASYPGDLYPIADIPALRGPAFQAPTADEEITYDQWGALISGYAPIHDDDGNVIAIIGIDMRANDYLALAHSIFSPIILLLAIAGAILLAAATMYIIWKRRISALRNIDEERNALLHLTSHQLGAPIASLRWWLEILKEEKNCTEDGPCDHMQDAIDRLSSIMDALTTAGSISKTMHYRREPTSLQQTVMQACDAMADMAQKKKITVNCMMSCDPSVRIDPTLTVGVIEELLENAISFSPEQTTVTVEMNCTRHEARISIADEGCGIPTGEQERIFEKFTRGSNAEEVKPIGNGIGLYVARTIAELAGGSLWAETNRKKGRGSIFTFTLPI